MAIGNVELMHECLPKHSRMGTATMKQDEETEGEMRVDSMERSKTLIKKGPGGLYTGRA